MDDKAKDFEVIQLKPDPLASFFEEEVHYRIMSLDCVKSFSPNKKIKGHYSTFLNLHGTSLNNNVFHPSLKEGRRKVQGKEEDQDEQRRQLFIRGDFSNLADEFSTIWEGKSDECEGDYCQIQQIQYTGKGVKIAIFDSGISNETASMLNIVDIVDFTKEDQDNDATSHGTFIASVIGSKNPACPGIAPDAELYIFKVFNKNHDSYTEWFLEAFNFAIEQGIDIINLSNGSSDFQDNPFIDKINEVTGHGITVVSSIGNDGPDQGTLNNPADMTNVIGVGSLNQAKTGIAHFSSRGITTWNLLKEYGIVKPDVITLGEKIGGLDIDGGCTVSSGTSVSSGIISGSLAVILSSLEYKPNPALIKSHILKNSNKDKKLLMSYQTGGVFDLNKVRESLKPKKNSLPIVFPERLDLTDPSNEPFSSISFYSTMSPISFNFTVIHPSSKNGSEIEDLFWKTENEFVHDCLKIQYEKSDAIEYYTLVKMTISVDSTRECRFVSAPEEDITTYISFTSSTPGEIQYTTHTMKINLIPTPERSKRILMDAYHNLKFPEDGYILRDSIFVDKQPYEWKGDHLFTNYLQLYKFLRSQEYHIEILNEPITCFDSRNYAAFILADPEKALSKNEVIKLRKDIEIRGLSLIIIAEWSDEAMIEKHTFKSEFTKKEWKPVIGGSDLRSINTLLKPYGIMFKESSYSGTIAVGEEKYKIESGAVIQKFPNKGYLFAGKLVEDVISMAKIEDLDKIKEEIHPLIGIYDLSDENNNKESGSILAIGDSYCIESSAPVKCYNLLDEFLRSLNQKIKQSLLFSPEHLLNSDFNSSPEQAPLSDTYREDPTTCIGTSFFSVKDTQPLLGDFSYEQTSEILTRFTVLDDAKYTGGEDWVGSLVFKNEIIVLLVIAMGILCCLVFYVWWQRKRNIK